RFADAIGRGHWGVDGAHDKSIDVIHLIIGDEELEIPGWIAVAAAAGGLGKAHVVAGAEKLGIGKVAADAEVPGLGEARFRLVEYQGHGKIGVVGESAGVGDVQMSGVDSVAGGGCFDPTVFSDKMNVGGFGLVDIAG